jgi:hypothetical protein
MSLTEQLAQWVLSLATGEIFRTLPAWPSVPPSLLYNGYRVSFPGAERQGRGVEHPPSPSAEVKETVELYLKITKNTLTSSTTNFII